MCNQVPVYVWSSGLFSSVWNNPEDHSFTFRFPFQLSPSGFSRLCIVAISFSAMNTYSSWGCPLWIHLVILDLPNCNHLELEEWEEMCTFGKHVESIWAAIFLNEIPLFICVPLLLLIIHFSMITSIFLKLHGSSFTSSSYSLDYRTEPETNKWKYFASEAWVKLIRRAALAWVWNCLFP